MPPWLAVKSENVKLATAVGIEHKTNHTMGILAAKVTLEIQPDTKLLRMLRAAVAGGLKS